MTNLKLTLNTSRVIVCVCWTTKSWDNKHSRKPITRVQLRVQIYWASTEHAHTYCDSIECAQTKGACQARYWNLENKLIKAPATHAGCTFKAKLLIKSMWFGDSSWGVTIEATDAARARARNRRGATRHRCEAKGQARPLAEGGTRVRGRATGTRIWSTSDRGRGPRFPFQWACPTTGGRAGKVPELVRKSCVLLPY